MQNDFFFEYEALSAVAKLDDALVLVVADRNDADGGAFLCAKLDNSVDLLIFQERERQIVIDNDSRNKGLYLTLEV